MYAKSPQSCLTLWDPWTVVHQTPLPVGFFRQEYWSGLPCLPPGDLTDPGIKSKSLTWPALASEFFIIQFSSVQSSPTVCDPMEHSAPGLPVHHQLQEFTQTHVHWVGDAIKPSHPLSSPFPPAFNLSQHQGLFQWVTSLHQVARVLEFQHQHQSFQWTPRTDLF